MAKSKVAVIKTKSASILEDIEKLTRLAGMDKALSPGATTILKDNISWHFPFPAANTTPWQMEGTILALRNSGFEDQVCVQNKTVITNTFKGEDLNNYVPIFRKYKIPVLYNFRESDMRWIAPALARPNPSPDLAEHILQARLAAEKDPEGTALSSTLAAIAAQHPANSRAAE